MEADTISLTAGMIESGVNHDVDWVVQWDVSTIKVRWRAASVLRKAIKEQGTLDTAGNVEPMRNCTQRAGS